MYTFFLTFAALLYAPYFFWQMLVKGKYRKSFLKRFGRDFPEVPVGKKVIWVHAVSFGETKAVMPLIKRLKESDPDYWVLLTTVTETGYAEAKKGSADAVHYLPFDFIIRPYVRKAKPFMVILCETDYWYNFLDEAKRNDAIIAVVNGKISESSLKRFKSVPFFTHKLFDLIDMLIVQNSLYKNRFLELGIPEEKLKIGGNIKLDTDPEPMSEIVMNEFKAKLHIKDEPVLVVGSTHDPEEELFLKVYENLKLKFPNLKMILVPRHPERFDTVAKLIEERKMPYSRFSKGVGDSHIILIDGMGLLRKCYQVATIAAVCGSWTSKVGGHNILEPSYYGKPVIFGPYMSTQPDFLNLINEYKAGLQITEDELYNTLDNLLSNKELGAKLGSQGKMLTDESKGALSITYSFVKR